jgi:molybdate transport system substrate-binding protein
MRRRQVMTVLGASACLAGGTLASIAAEPRPALVAVAASVQRALEEIAPEWMRATGHRLSLVYGSSGNFVRQIQQGLPVELFLSADETFVFKLAEAALTRDRGVVYASGRLALVLARGSAISLDDQLRGLKAEWAAIRKFAIANPELAPYGEAAREVLQAAGLWERAQSKLVMGENIAQVTQFVATGSAQAGITALSLLAANPAPGLGRHLALPDTLHAPLHHRMVLLRRAGAAANSFYEHLRSGAAKSVFRRHGFVAD